MVEQIPVKDKVKGSNPFAGAKVDYRCNLVSYQRVLPSYRTIFPSALVSCPAVAFLSLVA